MSDTATETRKLTKTQWTARVKQQDAEVQSQSGKILDATLGLSRMLVSFLAEWEAQGLSRDGDFVPHFATVIGRGEDMVKKHLAAVAVYDNGVAEGWVTEHAPKIGVDSLAALATIPTEARPGIVAETGGAILPTRKAVSAFKKAQQTPEQQAATAKRKAERDEKAATERYNAVTPDIRKLLQKAHDFAVKAKLDPVAVVAFVADGIILGGEKNVADEAEMKAWRELVRKYQRAFWTAIRGEDDGSGAADS